MIWAFDKFNTNSHKTKQGTEYDTFSQICTKFKMELNEEWMFRNIVEVLVSTLWTIHVHSMYYVHNIYQSEPSLKGTHFYRCH